MSFLCERESESEEREEQTGCVSLKEGERDGVEGDLVRVFVIIGVIIHLGKSTTEIRANCDTELRHFNTNNQPTNQYDTLAVVIFVQYFFKC